MQDKINQAAEIFKALSHPTRLAIICGLINFDECNVSKIVDELGLLQPNISQHLTILKNAGIIKGYRKGSQVCYRITNESVRNILKDMDIIKVAND